MDEDKDYDYNKKEDKLRWYENWSRWSALKEITLEEKGLLEIVNGTAPAVASPWTISLRNKEKAKAAKILMHGVSDDLFKVIEDTRDPAEIWK